MSPRGHIPFFLTHRDVLDRILYAEIGKAVAAGFPHHIVQRGINRYPVFFDAKDRKQHPSLKYILRSGSPR